MNDIPAVEAGNSDIHREKTRDQQNAVEEFFSVVLAYPTDFRSIQFILNRIDDPTVILGSERFHSLRNQIIESYGVGFFDKLHLEITKVIEG